VSVEPHIALENGLCNVCQPAGSEEISLWVLQLLCTFASSHHKCNKLMKPQ